MGRRPFTPTPEQRQLVQNMAGIGIRQEDIVHCLPPIMEGGKPISLPTLRKYFAEELGRGNSLARMRLARRAFDMAMDGHPAMLIFLLKVRLGWSETVKVENTGAGGAPLFAGPALYLPAKGSDPTAEPSPEPEPASQPDPRPAPTPGAPGAFGHLGGTGLDFDYSKLDPRESGRQR